MRAALPAGLADPEGETRFETAEGLLRNIDSPSARVLSLFSLHSIVRRLNLDFRDLFEKGLFFRKLGFTGKISDGVWHNSDLLLQADAGICAAPGSCLCRTVQLTIRCVLPRNLPMACHWPRLCRHPGDRRLCTGRLNVCCRR